ncbi:MAG: glycosyltransferase family 2 protein [Flavobacteriaceae bacterium]|jgi:dolichol-phosphate mannosyltransferase|nr:glycosyltransferase family 2 protein [Flavobacteriaceae bacterium]
MVHSFDLTLKNINEKFDIFDLSVVIPVYNESLNIAYVLDSWDSELKKNNISYCFVIVNDGSTDDSLKIIKLLRYNIFLLDKHNSGHGRSIRLGYDFSINFLKSSHILQIDSDGQCDIKYFKHFWKIKNDYDFILGNRTTRGDGLIRKLTSKVSLYATSLLTSMNLKDPNTPYRLFNYETLKKSLPLINESFDIHNIALTYVIFKGDFKVKTVDISFPNRIGGENSINILKVFQMGLNMLFDLFFLKKRLRKL